MEGNNVLHRVIREENCPGRNVRAEHIRGNVWGECLDPVETAGRTGIVIDGVCFFVCSLLLFSAISRQHGRRETCRVNGQ